MYLRRLGGGLSAGEGLVRDYLRRRRSGLSYYKSYLTVGAGGGGGVILVHEYDMI